MLGVWTENKTIPRTPAGECRMGLGSVLVFVRSRRAPSPTSFVLAGPLLIALPVSWLGRDLRGDRLAPDPERVGRDR